ncbi:MAG: hypothetical protein HZB23_14745 [Deltaproteobacteria bacterium]|nr:hypothetical protein [Deltaproteobacteria bacterium]
MKKSLGGLIALFALMACPLVFFGCGAKDDPFVPAVKARPAATAKAQADGITPEKAGP